MQKIYLLVIAAALSASVHADNRAGQPPPSYEVMTDDIGAAIAIDLPISECSQPSATLEDPNFPLVESNFTYFGCQQEKTATYAVTGDFWNQNRNEVSGTASIAFELKQISAGGSISIDAGVDADKKPLPVSAEKYAKAVSDAVSQCNSLRSIALTAKKSLASTQCAGQVPSN